MDKVHPKTQSVVSDSGRSRTLSSRVELQANFLWLWRIRRPEQSNLPDPTRNSSQFSQFFLQFRSHGGSQHGRSGVQGAGRGVDAQRSRNTISSRALLFFNPHSISSRILTSKLCIQFPSRRRKHLRGKQFLFVYRTTKRAVECGVREWP